MTHKISGVPIAIIGGLPMRWVVTCLLVALLGSLDSATFAAKPVPTYRWEPVTLKAPFAARDGAGALVYKKGGFNFASVVISNDGELAETVNNITSIMEKRLEAFKVSTSTWQEQFIEAFEVEGGTDDDGEDVEPSPIDYICLLYTSPSPRDS